MRVLQIGKFYPIYGGVEKVMYDLAKGLHCDMLCASADGEKDLKIIPLNEGGRLIVAPTLFKAAGTMIAPKMVSWLKAHISDYDIVHIHHPDPMAGLALRLSGFKGKVILHWHSDIIQQKFFLTFYKPIQSWLIKRAAKIVGTSPVYVKESPALKDVQAKTAFVPIGIAPLKPEDSIVKEILQKYSGKKIVFSLGRLVPYKGYDNLIKAACYLPEDYQVVIGGSGPLMEKLEALIQELGLGSRVSLIGYVQDREVSPWFAAADVFVLCSVTKNEAFGIVQIEAMSLGTPVVATKIPESGVSWVNKDGYSGINVNPEDPQALADAILAICENETRYMSFCEGALTRYKELFTKEIMINKINEIYEEV